MAVDNAPMLVLRLHVCAGILRASISKCAFQECFALSECLMLLIFFRAPTFVMQHSCFVIALKSNELFLRKL